VTENESLEHDNIDTDKYKVTLEEVEHWRSKGPLGKLHNFVVYIQRSTQRIQQFKKLSHGRALVRDNSTRWNSWYSMIKVATSVAVKEGINRYFATHRDDECALDELSPDDWDTLSKIKHFLESFEHVTKALEGRSATLDEALPAMDFVLEKLENGKEQYKADKFMAPSCNSGWSKIDKYYSKTSDSPAYAAAIVLNPSLKWQTLELNWHADWLPPAKKAVQELWESYKPATSTSNQSISSKPSTFSASNRLNSTTNTYRLWQQERKLARQAPFDEYVRYCHAELVYVDDPRRWWLEDTQQKLYPNLSKMALDMLSIPAMSADPERLFSGAKISITDRRNRLGIETVQALECLKSWLGVEEWKGDNYTGVEYTGVELGG
jgi:hypothetical protein